MRLRTVALAGALVLAFGNAQAALFDRGGGLIYDDVLNITWLQDANYAKTSGYTSGAGTLNWNSAMIWADGLTYGGYDDWRLPNALPVNGQGYTFAFANDGTTDSGYNIISPASELAYMFYVNLGGTGHCAADSSNPQSCVTQSRGIAGAGPFQNLQAWYYWTGTSYTGAWANQIALDFELGYGFQGATFKTDTLYAWAVRDGDVAAPVPEPETYAMMVTGLGLLGVVARRRKHNG